MIEDDDGNETLPGDDMDDPIEFFLRIIGL